MLERGIIELKGISKSFGDKKVLHAISIELAPGKIYGIIGKSGCGKTTLLNILIGFLKPTTGDVYYKGKNLNKNAKEVKKSFGFASQLYSFYPKMNVNENLHYFGKLYGLSGKEIENRRNILLESFKLYGEQKTLGEALSSGMKKRLDIACALIHDPEVLILDEPTADLDPTLRREILELIKRINAAGRTVIITTHLLGEIDYVCDEVYLIHNHTLKKVGTPEEFDKGFKKEVAIRLKSRDYNKLIGGLKMCPVEIDQTRVVGKDLVITTKNPELLMQYVMAYSSKHADAVEHINISRPSLDRMFEELTR